MATETVIFSNRVDARRVSRRLRDYNVLSRLQGREVVIEIPTKSDADKMRALALRIHNDQPAA